jgi:hypothetical protein
MATIDFTGESGLPYIPPFSTTPVTVSRWPSLDSVTGGLRDRASSAVDDVGDRARGAAADLADRARSEAGELGDRAVSEGQQLVDRGAAAAHGAVDRAAGAANELLGGTPEEQKAKANEMYDLVLQQLKRDLLHELEATGHLTRDY